MKVYTDGAYKPSTDQGGWAYIVIDNDTEIYSDYGGKKNTTNNQMEIMAVIQALHWLMRNNESGTIYTDSQYVWGTINKNWKRNKNQNYWKVWDLVFKRWPNVKVEWVKGHSTNEFNNKADKLAVKGSELLIL